MNHTRALPPSKTARALLGALLCLAVALAPAELLSMRGDPSLADLAPRPGNVRAWNVDRSVRMAVNPLARHPQDARLSARVVPLARPDVPSAAAGARPLLESQIRRTAFVKITTPAAPAQNSPAATEPVVLERAGAPQAPETSQAEAALPAVPATPPLSGKQVPLSVLVAGDSLSIDLAAALEQRLAETPNLRLSKLGKVSSGLARPDFFDWEKTMEELAAKRRPDVALIMIAANDNQTLRGPAGPSAAFGRPGWNEEYARRVQTQIDILRRHNPQSRIFWIGAPAMADPGLDRDVAAINAVIKAQVEKNPRAWFVNVRPALAGPDGRFAAVLELPSGKRLKIRAGDGVHLAPAGARLLADACLRALSGRVDLAAGRAGLAEIASR